MYLHIDYHRSVLIPTNVSVFTAYYYLKSKTNDLFCIDAVTKYASWRCAFLSGHMIVTPGCFVFVA